MFRPGRFVQNWNDFMNVVDDGDWLVMPVLQRHIEEGKQRNARECPAARMLKDYFGPNCRPVVEENKTGQLTFRFSRPETRQRVIVQPRKDSRFSPQAYDEKKPGLKCGSFIVDGEIVRVVSMEQPREHNAEKAKAWKAKAGYKKLPPKERIWSKSL